MRYAYFDYFYSVKVKFLSNPYSNPKEREQIFGWRVLSAWTFRIEWYCIPEPRKNIQLHLQRTNAKQRENLLKIESVCSFEMLVNFCQITRRHKPQGSGLHRQRLANPKAHRLKGLW